eukprot:TRINITY_DN12859_c0_g1_i1.p1 TRINITY_DN12859_c0_g1~~TRINITY_DN12859_c0_g1_i1.p1  ORF type:complete len:408 (-),score=62.61 TRINITY_DN12859_c0_g1_i1:92-1315(-)
MLRARDSVCPDSSGTSSEVLLSCALKLIETVDAPETFHLVDLDVLRGRHRLWKQCLPAVEPYYAVKTNPDPRILKVLADLGCGFDVASRGELALVNGLDIPGNRCVFAHPRKSTSAIRVALQHRVPLLVVDSMQEVERIIAVYPDAQLILRLKSDDSGSWVPLSAKFGASIDEARTLIDALAHASLLEKLVGVSFHVGSNARSPDAYTMAIAEAGELFMYAVTQYGYSLCLLDIGGGWSGTDDDLFVACAYAARDAIQQYMPTQIRVIAEPGRFFAARTTLIAAQIVGKKHLLVDGEVQRGYYLTDGAYGSFLSAITYQYNAVLLASEGFVFGALQHQTSSQSVGPQFMSRLWGPTCDAYDRVVDCLLPEMDTGAYVYTLDGGAYSNSTQTFFNGFGPAERLYVQDL